MKKFVVGLLLVAVFGLTAAAAVTVTDVNNEATVKVSDPRLPVVRPT